MKRHKTPLLRAECQLQHAIVADLGNLLIIFFLFFSLFIHSFIYLLSTKFLIAGMITYFFFITSTTDSTNIPEFLIPSQESLPLRAGNVDAF